MNSGKYERRGIICSRGWWIDGYQPMRAYHFSRAHIKSFLYILICILSWHPSHPHFIFLCDCASVCSPSHNQTNFELPHLMVTTFLPVRCSATQSTRSRNDIQTKCFRRAFSFILSRSHALNKFLSFLHLCHFLLPLPPALPIHCAHNRNITKFVRTYNVCILMK